MVITAKGHEVLAEMAEVGVALTANILGGIPPQDVKMAEDVLFKMRGNILANLDRFDL